MPSSSGYVPEVKMRGWGGEVARSWDSSFREAINFTTSPPHHLTTSPPHHPTPSRPRLYLLTSAAFLLLLCWFLFFYRLADRDLWSSHEGRAAQDAQSILSDHQWGLPRLFDGKIELQKPPLYYWLVAGITALRGGPVDAWSVRLPAAASALGSVLLLFVIGLWRGRALAGTLAGVMLATALHYTWLARTGRIDMPLSFAVAVALTCLYHGLERRQPQPAAGAWVWFLLAYLAVAVAALLKGPIGLILPAAAASVYFVLEGKRILPRQHRPWLGLMRQFGLWWGVPLVLALVLPWFFWANVQTHGQLWEVFFWKHNVERGFGAGSLPTHPWWFYGPRLSFDLLPWSLLLPPLVWLSLRRGWWGRDPDARFGLVWLLTMVLLLSFSRFKRADYLLPAYPGGALFLGCIAERYAKECRYRAVHIVGFASILSGLVIGWWIYLAYCLPGQEPRQEFRRFAEEIRRRAPAPQLVLLFRTEAHALAFHVGRPIDTILEWENLDVWASRPGTYYVVMPPQNAEEWPQYVKSGRLEEVLRSTDLAGGSHAHPLVLLRTTGASRVASAPR